MWCHWPNLLVCNDLLYLMLVVFQYSKKAQCFPTPHILCCEEASSFVKVRSCILIRVTHRRTAKWVVCFLFWLLLYICRTTLPCNLSFLFSFLIDHIHTYLSLSLNINWVEAFSCWRTNARITEGALFFFPFLHHCTIRHPYAAQAPLFLATSSTWWVVPLWVPLLQ